MDDRSLFQPKQVPQYPPPYEYKSPNWKPKKSYATPEGQRGKGRKKDESKTDTVL